jgi:hypothetical protein
VAKRGPRGYAALRQNEKFVIYPIARRPRSLMDDRLVSPKFGKVTKPTRCMENEKGTNPEELIAAAHSRCTLEGIDPAS